MAFNLYWSQVNRKKIRFMMTVQKILTNKIMVEHKTDFINHSYVILIEICKLDSRFQKSAKKIRIVNIDNNRFGRGCT